MSTISVGTSSTGGSVGTADVHRPSLPGVLGLVVAGAYALGIVSKGFDFFGEATWPAELGFSTNGDNAYPMAVEAFFGGVLAVIGLVLVLMVAAALSGARDAQVGAALLLAGVVAAGTMTALTGAGTVDHCVTDTYNGAEVCVDPEFAARRDGLRLALPALLALAGVASSLRRPRTAADGVEHVAEREPGGAGSAR